MTIVDHPPKRRKRPEYPEPASAVALPDEDRQRWQAWLDAPAAEKPRLWWLFQTRGRHDGEREVQP